MALIPQPLCGQRDVPSRRFELDLALALGVVWVGIILGVAGVPVAYADLRTMPRIEAW